MPLPYQDRADAGRVLADALKHYGVRSDVLVLALPRGGVPVAHEVALALHAPMDILLVRKLGLPRRKELAMGAIASGGVRILNQELVERLAVSPETIEAVAQAEEQELQRRERAYRGTRPEPQLQGRCVILVDDGLATGATMRAAVAALQLQAPARIVVAVPVAPPGTAAAIAKEVDEFVCPATPESFFSVSQWYSHFPQTPDEEVRNLLARDSS